MAHLLLEKRLIACANILGSIASVYSWEGEIVEGKEVAVLFKTIPSKVSEAMGFIQTNHSYDIPAILELPVGEVSSSFQEWVIHSLMNS